MTDYPTRLTCVEKHRLSSCELVWIPPCRKNLEQDKDYDLPPSSLPNIDHVLRRDSRARRLRA